MVELPKLFDQDEFNRWFNQAEHTLRSATSDMDREDYDWSCFKSQQAAEYAVKALLRGLGKEAIGHSVLKLTAELGETGCRIGEELKGRARSIDKHYIPPRYPNAYAEGSPFEFYDRKTAEEAIDNASEILEFITSEKERHA